MTWDPRTTQQMSGTKFPEPTTLIMHSSLTYPEERKKHPHGHMVGRHISKPRSLRFRFVWRGAKLEDARLPKCITDTGRTGRNPDLLLLHKS